MVTPKISEFSSNRDFAIFFTSMSFNFFVQKSNGIRGGGGGIGGGGGGGGGEEEGKKVGH